MPPVGNAGLSWLPGQRTWITPHPRAIAEIGPKNGLSTSQPAGGSAGQQRPAATCWKVCAEGAARAGAGSIPGSQLVRGQSGLLFSAGGNFSRGRSRAARLWSAQLAREAPAQRGTAMRVGTPLPTASLGCPAKSASNMAEIPKPDVPPTPRLQGKGKGLGLPCGRGSGVGAGWRLPVGRHRRGCRVHPGVHPALPCGPPRSGCPSPGGLWRGRKPNVAESRHSGLESNPSAPS